MFNNNQELQWLRRSRRPLALKLPHHKALQLSYSSNMELCLFISTLWLLAIKVSITHRFVGYDTLATTHNLKLLLTIKVITLRAQCLCLTFHQFIDTVIYSNSSFSMQVWVHYSFALFSGIEKYVVFLIDCVIRTIDQSRVQIACS